MSVCILFMSSSQIGDVRPISGTYTHVCAYEYGVCMYVILTNRPCAPHIRYVHIYACVLHKSCKYHCAYLQVIYAYRCMHIHECTGLRRKLKVTCRRLMCKNAFGYIHTNTHAHTHIWRRTCSMWCTLLFVTYLDANVLKPQIIAANITFFSLDKCVSLHVSDKHLNRRIIQPRRANCGYLRMVR